MSTSVKLLIAVMVLAVQLAVPLTMIRGREAVLRKGEAFNFLTRPIDPIDPFQGRYVRLGLARDFIPGEESEANDLDYRNPLYETIAADEDGFAEFTSWSLDEPETGHYLKTRYAGPMLEWRDERETRIYKGIRVRIPFDRFYMDEAKAPRSRARSIVPSTTAISRSA